MEGEKIGGGKDKYNIYNKIIFLLLIYFSITCYTKEL